MLHSAFLFYYFKHLFLSLKLSALLLIRVFLPIVLANYKDNNQRTIKTLGLTQTILFVFVESEKIE